VSYRERLVERERLVGRPVRVGMVGAGQMGRGLAAQIGRIPGMTLAAVVDLDEERARLALRLGGGGKGPEDAVALTEAAALPELDLDVVVEVTGVPDIGARVAQSCLLAGQHVVLLNVETDVTVGRYLDAIARSAGLVYGICHGDEPVAAKELVDFAHDLAFEVVCAGKGKNNPLDRAATPSTLSREAAAKGMNPKMLASFVDGSKTMIEMAALANATGLVPDVAGMHGPSVPVQRLAEVFRPAADGGILSERGRVDYAFGPAPGVFVIVATDDATVAEEMTYLSMGDGPYWCFYRPYHLASLEAPRTIAMAALDGESALRPAYWAAEVVACAKRDLVPGDVIDGIGGETVYGFTYKATDAVGLAPLGLVQGATVVKSVARGEPLPLEACELRPSAIAHLRGLQDVLFPLEASAP
jgi:predicted homoserine dehydrogenase-like protein